MAFETGLILRTLLNNISGLADVRSIGISGGRLALPEAGEGDIDVFIYCEAIPSPEIRKEAFKELEYPIDEIRFDVFESVHWGIADLAIINGVETWLMYFTVTETLNNVESIVNGEYPDNLDN